MNYKDFAAWLKEIVKLNEHRKWDVMPLINSLKEISEKPYDNFTVTVSRIQSELRKLIEVDAKFIDTRIIYPTNYTAGELYEYFQRALFKGIESSEFFKTYEPGKVSSEENIKTIASVEPLAQKIDNAQPLNEDICQSMIDTLDKYIKSRRSTGFWFFHNKDGLTEEKVKNAQWMKGILELGTIKTVADAKRFVNEVKNLNKDTEHTFGKTYFGGTGQFDELMNGFNEMLDCGEPKARCFC